METDYRKLGVQDHDDTFALYAEMVDTDHAERETAWQWFDNLLAELKRRWHNG
jgi:hypothetical protein